MKNKILYYNSLFVLAMAAWIKHGASVGCSEPQPRMLDMFEELGLSRGIGTYIYPSCTWVRRCGGSGCCTSDLQECASVPGTRTNVTKPVRIGRHLGTLAFKRVAH